MAKQNMKLIEKFSHKITQEARKDMVLSQMANPKVSQIQNENEKFVQTKNMKQMFFDSHISIDEFEWNKF